ncbi:MAG: carboxylesterase family protein [Prolixibacteraceae bacterium]
MKKLFFFLVISLGTLSIVLGNERYRDVIADSVITETYSYAKKNNQQLDLDIYLPAGDQETSRPVFLYVHGGGFSGGARDEAGVVEFCKKVARRGYVAVSISYRLTRKGTASGFGCDCSAEEKLATFAAAVEDLHDATSFLIEHQEKFSIDPRQMILAGSSAGAETVLDGVYDQPYLSAAGIKPYAGVVSMAGAIPDTARVTEETAIPSLFFHGTCDNLVPYGKASHRYCKPDQPGYLILNGGQVIAEKLRLLGKPYWLHTTCGGNHSLAGSPMELYFEEIMEFCREFVLNGKRDQIHTIIDGEHQCDYPEYNFCPENDNL